MQSCHFSPPSKSEDYSKFLFCVCDLICEIPISALCGNVVMAALFCSLALIIQRGKTSKTENLLRAYSSGGNSSSEGLVNFFSWEIIQGLKKCKYGMMKNFVSRIALEHFWNRVLFLTLNYGAIND